MAKVTASVDSPFPNRSEDNGLGETVSSPGEVTAVPAWLAARRSRIVRDESVEATSAVQQEPVDDCSASTNSPSLLSPVLIKTDDSVPGLAHKISLWQQAKESVQRGSTFWIILGAWVTQLVQYYSTAMIGASVSVAAHAVLIISLAVLMIGGAADSLDLNIFGAFSKVHEAELSDVVLDSSLNLDPGEDAAALEIPDLTQVATEVVAGFDPGESLRGVINGVGQGDGTGGDGEAMPVPTVNVPAYAVTKGSFSAWTDPRDPNPGKIYYIVIQVRLPDSVKKYRASDLTGMVVGTDLYRQVIKFRSTEEFPIKDGGVQVRIPVPGAAKLVRDTIRIESRLLREKQTIQIEF